MKNGRQRAAKWICACCKIVHDEQVIPSRPEAVCTQCGHVSVPGGWSPLVTPRHAWPTAILEGLRKAGFKPVVPARTSSLTHTQCEQLLTTGPIQMMKHYAISARIMQGPAAYRFLYNENGETYQATGFL